MKRRTFLKTAGTAGVAASAGAFGILRAPRRAEAAWGEWPQDKLEAMIPPDRQAKKVLELYFYGGLNAFDGFYTVPEWGQNQNLYLWAFGANAVNSRFASCGFSGNLTEPFFEDEAGTTVHLGPWLAPLRERPDILDRMRIVVQRHDLLPHEGANPVALTGQRLGSPRLAGIGSSIQRYFAEQPGGLRPVPYAYVLYPGSEFPTDNVRSASAVGLHPGSARALSVTVDAGSLLTSLLARNTVGDANRERFDRAVDHYIAAYANRFRRLGKGKAARSSQRSDFEYAHYARKGAAELQSVLSSDLFSSIPGDECGTNTTSMPAMQARMAASLLTRPDNAARYVHWIDAGLTPHPSAGHDTHDSHVTYASRNVAHTLRQLVSIINEPGENDPNKLDLDETMIVINTEFGRTPYPQGGGSGLNHWPQGYVNVFIGGPIRERGIYGYITEDQGMAQSWISPTENRMLILMAMGIYPFSSQTFAVGDVGGGVTNELEAAKRLKEVYLGITD